MREFACLDVLLLPSGCILFPSGRLVRVISYIQAVLLASGYIFNICYNLDYIRNTIGKRPLELATWAGNDVGGILFVIIMNRKAVMLAKNMKSCVSSLTRDQKRSLRRYSMICLAIYVGLGLKEVASMVNHLLFSKSQYGFDSLHHVTTDLVVLYIQFNRWFITGILVYVFMVKVIRFKHQNYFDEVVKRMESDAELDSTTLAYERRNLFMTCESLIAPLKHMTGCWYTFIFLQTSAVVIEVTQLNLIDSEKVTSSLTSLHLVLFMLYLIWSCDEVIYFVGKQTDYVLFRMMRTGTIERSITFTTELKESADRDLFTICSKVRIDRSLVLTFLSALVSTTVLLIEIANYVAVRS